MDKRETKTDVTGFDITSFNSSGRGIGKSKDDEDEAKKPQSRVPFNLSDIYYSMTGDKYLHIFNHFEYECSNPKKAEELKRDGTMKDVTSLLATFTALGFKNKVYPDLHYRDILKEMERVWTMDHSTTSCVVVAILTHGRNGGFLLSSDLELYRLSELTDMMANAHPGLVGKPKVWLVQACRSGHVDDDLPDDVPNIAEPKQNDTLILYSSSPHYYAYRCADRGAWMMQSLCGIINRYYHSYDILQMLSFVNQAVSSKATSSFNPKLANKKQMPETEHTLKKLLKF